MALSVQEILNLKLSNPAFSYRPSVAVPVRSDMSFTRSTPGTTLTASDKLVERSAGTPLVFGKNGALLVSGQGKQELSAPFDVTTYSTEYMTVGTGGTALGKTIYQARETTDNQTHWVNNSSFVTPAGVKWALLAVCKRAGRDWVKLSLSTRDSNNSNVAGPIGEFNLANNGGSIKQSPTHVTTYKANVVDLEDGYKLLTFTGKYDSGYYGFNARIQVGKTSGFNAYAGDTTKGLDILGANVITGKATPQLPILGAKTKNKDDAEWTIPAGRWNPNEGAYYVEFAARRLGRGGAQRVLTAPNMNIYLQNVDPSTHPGDFRVWGYDGGAGLASGYIDGYARAKALITWKGASDWAIGLNGSDYPALGNRSKSTINRPNPASFLEDGDTQELEIHDLRYFPSWLPSNQRTIITS